MILILGKYLPLEDYSLDIPIFEENLLVVKQEMSKLFGGSRNDREFIDNLRMRYKITGLRMMVTKYELTRLTNLAITLKKSYRGC